MFVEAPARLHFGLIDLRGGLGRWFGGIGAAAPAPTLLVSACAADTLEVEGADADRAAGFARRFLAGAGIERGARVRVHRTLPPHAGLGSGHAARAGRGARDRGALRRSRRRRRRSPAPWAARSGRPSAPGRSPAAVSCSKGGRRRGHDAVAPLLARLTFPPTWRCIVAVPACRAGDQRSRRRRRVRAAAAAARARRRAGRASRADGAASGGRRWRSRDVRRRAERDSGDQRPLVRAGPGRHVRAGPERGAGAPHGGLGRVGRGSELVGSRRVRDRRRRAGRPHAGRARARCPGRAGSVYEGPFRTEGARVWRAICRSLRE